MIMCKECIPNYVLIIVLIHWPGHFLLAAGAVKEKRMPFRMPFNLTIIPAFPQMQWLSYFEEKQQSGLTKTSGFISLQVVY